MEATTDPLGQSGTSAPESLAVQLTVENGEAEISTISDQLSNAPASTDQVAPIYPLGLPFPLPTAPIHTGPASNTRRRTRQSDAAATSETPVPKKAKTKTSTRKSNKAPVTDASPNSDPTEAAVPVGQAVEGSSAVATSSAVPDVKPKVRKPRQKKAAPVKAQIASDPTGQPSSTSATAASAKAAAKEKQKAAPVEKRAAV
jgi:hypothetical protein